MFSFLSTISDWEQATFLLSISSKVMKVNCLFFSLFTTLLMVSNYTNIIILISHAMWLWSWVIYFHKKEKKIAKVFLFQRKFHFFHRSWRCCLGNSNPLHYTLHENQLLLENARSSFPD